MVEDESGGQRITSPKCCGSWQTVHSFGITSEALREAAAKALDEHEGELGEGGSAAHQKIRQNLDVAEYAKETGLPLQPFVIQQTSDDGDKLVRDWPAPRVRTSSEATSWCRRC